MHVRMVLSITENALAGAGSITAVLAPFALVRGEPLRLHELVCPSSITRQSTPRLRNSGISCNQIARFDLTS